MRCMRRYREREPCAYSLYLSCGAISQGVEAGMFIYSVSRARDNKRSAVCNAFVLECAAALP